MIFWILFVLLEVYRNYYLIVKRKLKPNYLQSFFIRGGVAIIHGILLDVNPQEYLPLLIFQVCSFWIIFDLLLNLFRKKKWNYKGETSGWLDKIEYRYYYILKMLAVFGAIFSYKAGLQYWMF